MDQITFSEAEYQNKSKRATNHIFSSGVLLTTLRFLHPGDPHDPRTQLHAGVLARASVSRL
ncbi:hypothetical protein, partial [Halomonas colorata]|uniref:hypothetical protein n=1 Tax=Halomonas colorata TaxID=2742615 RepID=UPI001CE3C6A1